MGTEELLNEREKTHGDYPTQAVTAQALKAIIRKTPNWEKMPDYMRESLDLIATKISRMCHGNYMEKEHSDDGAGYFALISRQLS